ncbi:MAG: type II toxin-antitoxin system HicB family antitoxin [Candidatus Scalindua sp.]|jgi:predicted RNase H-like HicB family nuclease|nr:type II toxin-antitoxin system HicB family antitoxin [Candidatus Scalindua sp.]MBT6046175.1 type II toxin-antitoxin system HicB family antitoxin [Candidatus Scalindua sp.]
MEPLKYVHWQDEEFFIGHFVDYPDYLTQGKSLEELKENLENLYNDLISEEIPYIKKVDELKIA